MNINGYDKDSITQSGYDPDCFINESILSVMPSKDSNADNHNFNQDHCGNIIVQSYQEKYDSVNNDNFNNNQSTFKTEAKDTSTPAKKLKSIGTSEVNSDVKNHEFMQAKN